MAQDPFYPNMGQGPNDKPYASYGSPPQGPPPAGRPTAEFCSPQNYCFVQGIGFVLRAPEEFERRQLRREGTRLGLSLLLSVALFYILRTLLLSIGQMTVFGRVSVALQNIINLALILLSYSLSLTPFFIYKRSVGIPSRVAFPIKAPRALFVVCGLFCTLALSSLGSITVDHINTALGLLGLRVTSGTTPLPYGLWEIAVYILAFVVITPVLEEVVFRGILLQALRQYGDGFAVLVSAALFALMHLSITALPFAFLAGLCIGYFVVRTGSLISGIIIHIANNLLVVVYEALARGMAPRLGTLFTAAVFAVYLLLGLILLVVCAKRDPILFMLHPANSRLTGASRVRYLFSAGVMAFWLACVSLLMLTAVHSVSFPW